MLVILALNYYRIMIRRYIFPIVLTLLFFLAVFFLCINSTYFLSIYFRRFVKQHFTHASLLSFQAEKQFYEYPDKLVLKDVASTFKYENDVFNLEADEIILYDVIEFVKNKERVRVTTKGLDVSVRNMSWRSLDLNASLTFRKKRLVEINGIFRNMVFEKNPYNFYDVSGKIVASKNIVEIVELTGYWETGLLNGQIKLERNPLREFAVFLSFLNFNPGELKVANSIYFNIYGLMDGTLRMAGSINTLDLFVLDLNMKQGGRVEPPLLGLFESVVSDKAVKEKFLSLLSQGQSFEFDKAAFLIHDFQDYRGQVMINLISQQADISWMERIPIKGRVNWLEFLGF